MAFYIVLKVLNDDTISAHPISLFLYKYKCHIMIGVIILPVVYQIYVYWLYSSIYKGYLKNMVSIEYERFQTSMEGIKNKEKLKLIEYILIFGLIQNSIRGRIQLLPPFMRN